MRVYYYFDPKGKSEDATNGNFDVIDDILKNQRIKISRISRLNDPFDFQVSFANTTPQGYVRGFRNRFKQIDQKWESFVFQKDSTTFSCGVIMQQNTAD